jgi:hypothetical protein
MSLIAMYDLMMIEKPAAVEGDGKPQRVYGETRRDSRTTVTV